ncbi:PREDICTED: vesicle transport protein SFT2B [Nicrophorus vespilloides]|uniref:Vesicle transport protein n=1 Tax=Nicrophorus vespilloides TaxID=110193 RepID=A0ABM1NJ86_NICVS|nr:PREDICTED: vesicle transport protein SFT2B [Nicrophorus vespilloides]
MDKLRRALSGDDEDDEERDIMSQFRDSATLSWNTRIKCFIGCFVVGILLTLLGSFAFFLGGITMFAVFYTLGNIVSIASTLFLVGPVSQMKKMFSHTRALATILVIVTFCLTLVAAIKWHKAVLVLVFIILQSAAMTWYSLSYIPYARDVVKKTVSACLV